MSDPRKLPVTALYLNVFVVATCGLVYELLAGALGSYLLGDSVTQFSLVIGLYLSAMGAGAWLYRHVEARPWGARGAQKLAGIGMVLLPFLAVCAGFTWAFSY